MMAACPCCGQPVDPNGLLVDLSTNTASRGDVRAALHPQQAEVLEVLRARWPNPCLPDALIAALYGQRDEPENAIEVVRVRISQLRKRLAPLGVSISSAYGSGYRLAITEGGSVIRIAKRRRAA